MKSIHSESDVIRYSVTYPINADADKPLCPH